MSIYLFQVVAHVDRASPATVTAETSVSAPRVTNGPQHAPAAAPAEQPGGAASAACSGRPPRAAAPRRRAERVPGTRVPVHSGRGHEKRFLDIL